MLGDAALLRTVRSTWLEKHTRFVLVRLGSLCLFMHMPEKEYASNHTETKKKKPSPNIIRLYAFSSKIAEWVKQYFFFFCLAF